MIINNHFLVTSDLTTWASSMLALVSSQELANDVSGAEALLNRHQVNKMTLLIFMIVPMNVFYKI